MPIDTDPTETVRHLVETVAKSMVDKVSEVRVSSIKGQQTTVIELKVDPSDLGKIIGKQGKNAQAIRTILIGASAKLKLRTVLEILE